MGKKVKIFLALLAIALILSLIWLTFFYSRACENQTCFNDYLKDCKRANFITSGGMVFHYKILGKSSEGCEVNVKLLQGDLSNRDSLKLEKKEMRCYLPFNTVAAPEADIGLCTGQLKEGLQDLLIQKLHTYIVQNLGKINAELMNISQV
jgi:hypothetical protein